MRVFDNYENAFNNGQYYWSIRDYTHARYWYEISKNGDRFRDISLSKLIQMEIIEGKYSIARQLLNQYKNMNSSSLMQVFGLLENVENNIERSKKYYSICMLDSKMQYISLHGLAKLYIQTGDYDIAKKIYETLILNDKSKVQALIGIICMYILIGNFLEAQKLLNEIDVSKLTDKLLHHYNILNVYIKYYLGQLKEDSDIMKGYTINRLFAKDDKLLIKHIDRHKNQSKKYNEGCFFKDLNTQELLNEAKEIIKDMNGNHFELSDMYRFRLDRPIGYKGDEITNDICVVTLIGTKNIITIHPVLLSDEFDKEGFSTSKELRIKRLQGGNKI